MSKTGRISVISRAATPGTQALAGSATPTWQALSFYTASTPRIPERSRLRRGLGPRSPVSCRPEPNDFQRLDRRGELLLRVVRVDRLRGRGIRVLAAWPDRARAAGDHPREHLRLLPAVGGRASARVRLPGTFGFGPTVPRPMNSVFEYLPGRSVDSSSWAASAAEDLRQSRSVLNSASPQLPARLDRISYPAAVRYLSGGAGGSSRERGSILSGTFH
jgi:hypothetical protein